MLIIGEPERCSVVGQKLFFQINGRDPVLAGQLMQLAPKKAVLRWRKTLLWVEAMKSVARWKGALNVDSVSWEGATLPSQPDVAVVEILADAATKKRSSSNPIIIPCVCQSVVSGKRFVQCFLMKEESLVWQPTKGLGSKLLDMLLGDLLLVEVQSASPAPRMSRSWGNDFTTAVSIRYFVLTLRLDVGT